MDEWVGKISVIEKDVGEIKEWKGQIEGKIKELQNGGGKRGGARGSGPDFGNEEGNKVESLYPPPRLRKTIIFGKFEEDTPREEIQNYLKTYVQIHSTVKEWIVPGRYANKGKVEFVTPKAMWAWVTANAGKKFDAHGDTGTIWWSVDTPYEERALGKKVGFVLKKVNKYLRQSIWWKARRT